LSSKPLTFQDAVARLQTFWADLGCAIWLPHNVEVGAGTMNPGTFLHVLGPEPWNVVYVEPSIRPDDARYGENPNRMGRHHQIQVILKPDPGDPQALYLDSLAAIGIDLRRHDIRFVEDNWESPALGAWGLGWEVWLDGLEITQFTYFQQAGSLELDPVSVEITYGLDRILMALQDVDHFTDLMWSERLRFGDVLLGYEQQTSRYYFEVADVERVRRLYDDNEAEARSALAGGLVRPAHDYVLRCSHLFNVLDARGAVGVTERAAFFGRMRNLSRQVAEGYLEERRQLGFPLLRGGGATAWVVGSRDLGAERPPISSAPPEPEQGRDDRPGPAADFVLEVGTEELPVADQALALAALRERVPRLLDDLRLEHGEVWVGGTPRRLAVLVHQLARRQSESRTRVVGPPAHVAFLPDGTPTKAGEGFARSVGVTPDQLEVVEKGGERRVAAVRCEAGLPVAGVLGDGLARVFGTLPIARSMRWNDSGQAFSRPVRWIVALHGAEVVPLDFGGVRSGRVTRGLRPLGSPEIPLATAGDYRPLLAAAGVLVDERERLDKVREQVAAAARGAGGRVRDAADLCEEVSRLVEQPAAVAGAFEERFLELPAPVLTTVLKKHQRAFAVETDDGALLGSFVAVANGSALDAEAVRHGNEAVVRARFADAAYFWRQDTSRALESFTPELAQLSYHPSLGSMLDKTRRLERLVPLLAARLGLGAAEAGHAARAATLAKSDLVTAMVVDFTSLQGVMGREYALLSGEPEPVATALYEQYLPRAAGDRLPETGPGLALALADRLDSLVGLFAAGVRPSGAQDPYALRRGALGVCAALVGREISFDLAAAIAQTAGLLPVAADAETQAEVLAFLARRLEGVLRDAGHAADAVAAVLAVRSADPWSAVRAVRALEAHIAGSEWPHVLTAYARCARIVRGVEGVPSRVEPTLLSAGPERDLHAAIVAEAKADGSEDADAVLAALGRLAPVIHAFFDGVLVMANEPLTRANRLALVGSVALMPRRVADLSLLEGF